MNLLKHCPQLADIWDDVMQGDMAQVLLNIQVTIQVKSGQQTLLKHSMHDQYMDGCLHGGSHSEHGAFSVAKVSMDQAGCLIDEVFAWVGK